MALSLQALVSRNNVHPVEPLIGGIACVVAPALVRLVLMPALGSALPFATFFPTVLLATLLWGGRWGAVVLVSSGLVAGLIFVQPSEVGLATPPLLTALGLFLVMGSLILLTGTILRNALIGLQAARQADAARKSELQHRLKNTLAIVQSFSSYLSRKTTDKAEFEHLLQMKIAALAKASDILFAESYESCTLSDTANGALAPFTQHGRITIGGPEIRLGADSCEPLVLALHELATNAHKYGALSAHGGHVDVTWAVPSMDRSKCVINWTESDGPPVQPPMRSGLGQHLLRRQKGLESVTLNYDPAGLRCEIVVRTVSVSAPPRRGG